MNMRIPTFKFHGSKCRISKWILDRVNFPVNNYFEPFAGRGNVFFRFASDKKFNRAFLNDMYLGHFLIALRDYNGNYDFVPEYVDREIYERLEKSSGFERSLAESFCAYNGTFWGCGANITNRSGFPSKNGHSRKSTIQRFVSAKRLLSDVDISIEDYSLFLYKNKIGRNDLVYCDPPYLGTSETSKVGPNIDHTNLCSHILTFDAKVILSGYANPIYDDMLAGWNKRSLIRSSCSKNLNGSSGKSEEFVWENF